MFAQFYHRPVLREYVLSLKRLGGWKSSTVAEGYVDDSLNCKRNTDKLITNAIAAHHPKPNSTVTTNFLKRKSNEKERYEI